MPDTAIDSNANGDSMRHNANSLWQLLYAIADNGSLSASRLVYWHVVCALPYFGRRQLAPDGRTPLSAVAITSYDDDGRTVAIARWHRRYVSIVPMSWGPVFWRIGKLLHRDFDQPAYIGDSAKRWYVAQARRGSVSNAHAP